VRAHPGVDDNKREASLSRRGTGQEERIGSVQKETGHRVDWKKRWASAGQGRKEETGLARKKRRRLERKEPRERD
jgi:hypothetical protein